MRQVDRDSLPHMVECLRRIALTRWHTFWARLAARWWGVHLDLGCEFNGLPRFRRYPGSRITIGAGCEFNSSHASNLIGVNRPCIMSTLAEGARVHIGPNCGFSGTVIGCASEIVLGENVRCGAPHWVPILTGTWIIRTSAFTFPTGDAPWLNIVRPSLFLSEIILLRENNHFRAR